MKISKILYKIVLLIILIVMSASCNCFATGLPSIDSGYQPSVTMPSGGKTMNIIVTILNVLTAIGVVGIVVSVALIGFNTILGSAGEKAQNQEKYVGLVIAALVIVGGSVIAKMIISVAESL